jgi:lysozyme
MRLSAQGAAAIVAYEGIYLYGYPDPGTGGEPITIGAGHTAAAGPPKPTYGMVITLRKALEIFTADMVKYEQRVERAIKRGLSQHAFDGFVSFDFNTGKIASGSVDDKWNAGQEAAALAVLNQYVNAAGRRLPGLVTRRASETAIIRDGRYPAAMVTLRETKGGPARAVLASSLPWPSTSPPVVTADIPMPAPVSLAPPLPSRGPSGNFLVRLVSWLWGRN